MSNIDEVLDLLQNKVRRLIMERLVREPHYPMQLAQQIDVSQQAIMKHLNILEKADFVSKKKVASDAGGPPKNIYMVEKSISIRIDLGPDLFRCEERKLPKGGPMRLSSRLPSASTPVAEAISGRKKISFQEGFEYLSQINETLDELDEKRDALIALHQVVKNKISTAVDSNFDTYEERTLVHNMLDSPRTHINLKQISEELRLGASATEQLMEEIRLRLLREIGEKSGTVISGPSDTKLPWWAMLGPDRNFNRR